MQACFADAPDDPAFIAAAINEVIRANRERKLSLEVRPPQNPRVIKL
jgi:hypothetical protein